LNEVTWKNTTLLKGDVAREVRKLKQGKGPDITIFGSGTIIQQLTREGLIDEYLLIVSPVIVGMGKLMFKDVNKLNLKLLETRSFHSGNVLLHYGLAGK
jgi:dihydrofolate reductase